MKIFVTLFVFLFSFSSYSQQQLIIKGIHPNFYIVHNVTSNDTYSSIAKLYNLPASRLASYNNLTLHNGKIFAKIINVPLTSQNFTQRTKVLQGEVLVPVDYILNTNETVTHVTIKYRISVQTLKELNNLTDQQLYTRGQLTVGYLKVLPGVASSFNLKKESVIRLPQPKTAAQFKKPEPSTEEKKVAGGVRLAKRRDDPIVETNPPVTIDADTLVAVQPQKPAETFVAKMPATRSNLLKVFVDCSNTWCDLTYIKTEINIVDFLLDRVASDVHMLVTSQRNGSGGSQYQMIFYGQNKFKNITKDTLRFNLDPNATESERRDVMLKYMKLGLTPFIAKTDYAKEVNIQMKRTEQDNKSASNAATKDKWNYWVFRAGANGNLNLDQVYKSSSYSGNFSANRTTDKIKISINGYRSQNVTKYEYQTPAGIEKFTVKNSSYEIEHNLVKSISEHWSLGYEAEYTNSTFSNNKSRISFSPAIEYAVFPYKEVNNKYFTISYGVDVRRNSYYDTTIYNKTNEILYGHNFRASLTLNQKWGNINSSISYRNFFHDWKLNNFGMELSVNVRITGGLSVNGYSFGGLIRDQIYLPKGGATEQEILTRRRQLASGYNFYSGFGLSYRFGSKLNNFVNPRFDAR